MSDVGKGIAAFVVLFFGLLLLGWGTSWFGLVTQRPMAKYQEETRKEVYDTSRQYQQGTNRDIARYCYQMKTAPNEAARAAVGGLIRSTLSTYDGPLTPDNAACAASVGAIQ